MHSKLLIMAAVGVGFSARAMAAPGLPVTKPPVQPVPSWTGPINDPHAVQGQWFRAAPWRPEMPQPGTEVRPFEFHDNVTGYGGGDLADPLAFDSWRSIYGKVTNITYAPGPGTITAFTIRARITDDRPAMTEWYRGTNSHGEWETAPPVNPANPNDAIVNPVYDPMGKQNLDPMNDVKLSVEFAISGLNNLPQQWTAPYRQGENPEYIVAQNFEELAWYCWTPQNPEPAMAQWGDFYVPTYDFGNIPIGGFVERDLTFAVTGAGIAPVEPRYSALVNSFEALWGEGDLFLNRTTDLKIGDWLDNVQLDTGISYPLDPLRGGNVSVFYAPEPAAVVGLLILGGMAMGRRRS